MSNIDRSAGIDRSHNEHIRDAMNAREHWRSLDCTSVANNQNMDWHWVAYWKQSEDVNVIPISVAFVYLRLVWRVDRVELLFNVTGDKAAGGRRRCCIIASRKRQRRARRLFESFSRYVCHCVKMNGSLHTRSLRMIHSFSNDCDLTLITTSNLTFLSASSFSDELDQKKAIAILSFPSEFY